MNIFESIYIKNKWRCGSGEGSLERYTKNYRIFLEKFLLKYQIKSVMDFGCGDWQFSKYINWGSVRYHGVDIVKSVIDNNKKEYQNELRHFSLIKENSDLEAADLFIAKDVFQHWSNEKVFNFLPQLQKYKYALITNCGDLPQCRNKDIKNGGFRTLDLSKAPFMLKGKYIFVFRTRPISLKNIIKWILPYQLGGLDYDNKKVFFIKNDSK